MTNYYNIYRIYDWYDKLELLTFISLLTGIALNINPISSLVATLVFTVTSLAYGFILNSYADREEDITVGKDRYFGQKEVTIKIPAGIRDGQTLKMTGHGEQIKDGKAGDLYINISVKAPTKISKRAKELLEELKKEGI